MRAHCLPWRGRTATWTCKLPLDPQQLPADDRAGRQEREEPPPELLQEIQRRVLEMNRLWLDRRIPALGNRTPRECCATPEGRQQVALLIRTIAPIHGPGGTIEPPRAALLRELGIES